MIGPSVIQRARCAQQNCQAGKKWKCVSHGARSLFTANLWKAPIVTRSVYRIERQTRALAG